MRILHTADWHLGRRLEGRSRHAEQETVLEEICRIVDEEQIDVVVVAGDVFDSYNPPAEAEALFYRTMTRLADGGRRAVVVLAGNHDSPERLIASDPYARALGITMLGYPKDTPAIWDAGPDRAACLETSSSFVRLRLRNGRTLALLALPYPSESRLREVLTERIEDDEAAALDYNRRVREFMLRASEAFRPGEPGMVASHLFLRNGMESDSERRIQVGGAYAVDPDSFPESARYVALGHLHRAQEQHGRHEVPIRYSGSILQYSFNEAGNEKSVTVVEFDNNRTDYRIIPLSAGRRLVTIRDVQGTVELEQRLSEVDPAVWLSVRIRLQEPLQLDYMARLRREHPGIISFVAEFEREDQENQDQPLSSLPLEEQFRRFVRQRYREEPNEEVVRLLMDLTGNDG